MFGRASLVVVSFVATAGIVLAAPESRRIAVIDIEGIEVRAGHAMSFAAVGQLHKGDKVVVVREEETGFLAIQPPQGTISWVRKIHLGKVEPTESGKANVTVMVDGAELKASNEKGDAPLNRVTIQLPKGTILEAMDKPVRIDGSIWYPVVPPEGDLRWIPKNSIRKQEMIAMPAPAPYYPPEPPPFTVSGGTETSKASSEGVVKPVAGGPPKVLADHKLWAEANRAERNSDLVGAKKLYARIYQDLWDQKAERDAIVIVYNRFTRCDELLKKGEVGTPNRTESRRESPVSDSDERGKPAAPQPQVSKGVGYLQELQKVFVDGQQVYAFNDDKGNVVYYATGVDGMNLKGYTGKRVQVYGAISTRAELYRPHIAVEKVEVAR